MKKIFFALLLVSNLGCGRTVTKHIRITRHVDSKPTEAFQMPLHSPRILSKFGERGNSFHTGVDMRGRYGSGDPVYAARSGRVMKEGWVRGYGTQITIEHSDGYKSRYAHLKIAKAHLGQNVKKGQVIGLVGKTGHASAPHLHFEIITPDEYFIDPLLLLP